MCRSDLILFSFYPIRIRFITSVVSLFKANAFLAQEMKLKLQFIAWKQNSFSSIFVIPIDLSLPAALHQCQMFRFFPIFSR